MYTIKIFILSTVMSGFACPFPFRFLSLMVFFYALLETFLSFFYIYFRPDRREQGD